MDCNTGFKIIIILIFIIILINLLQFNNIEVTEKIHNYDILADHYYYGDNNNKPDYKKALENYNKVLIYDSNNENIPHIRQNINNIISNNNSNDENHIIINNADFAFNYDINDYILDIADIGGENILLNDNTEIFNIDNAEIFNIDNTFNNTPNNQIFYNDFENVHDSVVNKTIDSSVNKLEKNTEKTLDIDGCIKYLYDNLKNNSNNLKNNSNNLKNNSNNLKNNSNNLNVKIEDKENITKTINYIKQHSNSKVRDRNLDENLILIVNKINNTEDIEKKDIMIMNLFYELKDCVRADGNMYCLTGISNRIINSLHGIDDSVVITPKWALREEMMRKCSNIRDELEKEYEDSDDDKFTEILKDNIRLKLEKEYVVDNNILSKEDLDKEINGWIDYV